MPSEASAAPAGAPGKRRFPLSEIGAVALFAILALALLASEGVIVRNYTRDALFVWDSIWRVNEGQIPHLDFRSAIGQAFYWPYYLVGLISGGSMFDLLHANILAGGVALLLALATLPKRLPPLMLFLAIALVLTTAMTGRSVDYGFRIYDHLAPYNRWGWTFGILAVFIMCVPARDEASRWRDAIDALCLAVALSLLFYIKTSFLLPVIPVAIIAWLLGYLKIRVLGAAAVLCLVFAGLVELMAGNNLAYLADIGVAADVNLESGRAIRFGRIAVALLQAGAFTLLAIVIFAAEGPMRPLGLWLKRWWRPLLLVAFITGASAMIHAQNHPRWEMGMLGAALIIGAELARRGGRGGVPLAWWRRLAGVGALVVGTIPFVVQDAASIFAHTIESRTKISCASPALAGTSLERFLFAAAPGSADGCSEALLKPFGPEDPTSEPAEQRRLLRTMSYLRNQVRGGEVVMALEFSNPYPFIFRAPAPRGAMAWWDHGRTYSDRLHPDPAALIGQADWVIQTNYENAAPPQGTGLADQLRGWLGLLPPGGPGYGQRQWALYGPTVQRDFELVHQTGEVSIWRRAKPRAHP